MLRIAVTDLSAESRNILSSRLSTFLSTPIRDLELLPRISIQPLALEEVRFHAAPDICFIGSEAVIKDMMIVREIRTALPNVPVVVCLNDALDTLSSVEQIARMGADDTFPANATAEEFFRKIVLLARKSQKEGGSTLILVDGGKGGAGVTSLAAAVGEACAARGKRTAVVDFDFETQDLSRFLQARPYINENLQLILDQSRPVTNECVEQCLTRVWHDDDALWCMSPASDQDALYDSRSTYPRTFVSLFESLDSLFEVIVVDVGCARGALLKTLYRVADKLLFVVNSDPASLYAGVDKISRVRSWMGAGGDAVIIENGVRSGGGLTHRALVQEFSSAAKIPQELWFSSAVSFSETGSRWPGSGGTLASFSSSRTIKSIASLVTRLLDEDDTAEVSRAESFFQGLREWRIQKFGARIYPIKSTAGSDDRTKVSLNPESPSLALRLPDPKPHVSSESGEVTAHHTIDSLTMSPEISSSLSLTPENKADDELSFVSRARVQ